MPEPVETTNIKQSKTPLYISAGIIAMLVVTYFFVPSVSTFMEESWQVLTRGEELRTRAWVSQFGWWGPMIIVAAMILQMFLLVVPTPVLMVVAILAYGPVWGSLILLVAIFSASSIGYFIGRYFGPVIVEKLIGPRSNLKISGFIDDYGFWAVIVARISPFLSNDAISFVAGILRMGYWKFIGATLSGITPLILFIAYLGGNYQRLESGLIWTSVFSILLFAVFVWWDRKVRKNKP